MAIVTDSKKHVGSEDRQSIDADPSFGRYEPLLTPDQLKRRFLFGVALVSATPDPITRVRAVMTPDDLQDFITRAANQIEMEVGVHISPVQRSFRPPFDRNDYRSLGFFRLPDAPILSVDSITVETSDERVVYTVPNQWIDSGQFHKGQVNLIPLSPAGLGGGVLPSMDAGGAAFLAILGQSPWIPSYWRILYTAGFENGHVPVMMNELIGTQAAILVLRELQKTNRVASYSVGIDAASQSIQTKGPEIYQTNIEDLEKAKALLIRKWKVKFFKRLLVENI